MGAAAKLLLVLFGFGGDVRELRAVEFWGLDDGLTATTGAARIPMDMEETNSMKM